MTQTAERQSDSVALVQGAGEGRRVGLGPKAFLKIAGESLVARSVRTLRQCVGRVVVGVPEAHLAQARDELRECAEVYAGGATRGETLLGLFEKSTEPLVVVHIVARPFVNPDRLRLVMAAAREHGAACAYLPALLDIARIDQGFATTGVDRATAGIVQLPMAFQRPILKRILHHGLAIGVSDHTPFELAMRLGIPVRMIPGDETNIKITTPLDWEIATQVIAPALARSSPT